MENDGFNKLVLHAGLTAREVNVLRAYCKYLRQARIPFSQAYLEATLARNPGLTRNLVDLFLASFDPRHQKQLETSCAKLVASIQSQLYHVATLDEDHFLRRYAQLLPDQNSKSL